MADSDNKPTLTALKDIAEAFTAYVAVPVVLLYPVGFLSRWLQIYQPYDIKVQTAWHATAVSDRLDVVGQGVLVLVPSLVLSVSLTLLLGVVVDHLWFRRKSHEQADLFSPQERRWWSVIFGLLIFLALLALLALFKAYTCTLLIGAWPRSPGQRLTCALSDWPIVVWSVIGYVVGCLFGGLLISRDFRRSTEAKAAQENPQLWESNTTPPEPSPPRSASFLKRAWCAFRRAWEARPLGFIRGLRERWVLWGLAVAYIVSIASVLFLSYYQEEPSLPMVNYANPDDKVTVTGDERDVGLLLSHHADGRWYILHSDLRNYPPTFEAEGQWDTEVLAIPDDVAGAVRFLRADPETVYAHKGESRRSNGEPTYYPGDWIRVTLDMMDDQSGVLSASVGLFQDVSDCHASKSEPDIKLSKTFDYEQGEVEQGAATKVLYAKVTADVPRGDYLCERIEVTDFSQGDNTATFYRSIQFRVAEDDEPPKLQDVQITK